MKHSTRHDVLEKDVLYRGKAIDACRTCCQLA